MRWKGISRPWRSRFLPAASLAAAGYAYALLLDLGPRPVPYVVMVSVVVTLVWLVLDTVEVEPAQWEPTLPSAGDRVDEATGDLRILTSHQQSSTPSEAVRDRLVALARARDPGLADTLRRELDPLRRLSPAEIDRILTRIEEARDRS